MVFPLLPAFIVSLGGTAVAVGLMEGTAESVSSFLKYASGRLSDRWRRRKELTIAGYAWSAISKLGYPLAAVPLHVVALRSADRIGKGVRGAPRDALIADTVPRRLRGHGFGFHRALDTLGALAGPLAGFALAGYLTIRELFLAAVIPALAGVLLLFAVREVRSPRPRVARVPFPHDPRLFSYLLAVAVFTLGNFGYLFLLLRGAEVGLDLSALLLIQIAYTAVYALLAWPLGVLTDRVGRAPVLISSFFALAAASVATVLLEPVDAASFLLPAAAFGVASAGFEGNGRALAVDLAPTRARASVLGAYHATIGFASLPAGLLMGLLWDVAWRLVFLGGALFVTVAALELIFLWSRGLGAADAAKA